MQARGNEKKMGGDGEGGGGAGGAGAGSLLKNVGQVR